MFLDWLNSNHNLTLRIVQLSLSLFKFHIFLRDLSQQFGFDLFMNLLIWGREYNSFNNKSVGYQLQACCYPLLVCILYVPTTYMISTEVYLTDLMWKITEWRNGNFGLQINNIAYNAYIYDLFAYPNPFF